MDQPTNQFEGAKLEIPETTHPTVLPVTILKEIRSWAITLLLLGVISIIASNFLSAPWGVLLILVGLASFYFRSSSMMVVYGVTLAWAGISNAISGQAAWIGFAIFQWFLAFRVFQKFATFRRAEGLLGEEELASSGLTSIRSASVFPWAAGALGLFSLLGLVGIFVVTIVIVALNYLQTVPQFFYFIEGLMVNFGVLGFAVGLASVLSKNPRRPVAIIGMVTGILTLLIEIIFLVL